MPLPATAPRKPIHTRRITFAATGGAAELVDTIRTLDEEGLGIDDIGLRRPTLDDVFLTLTGHAAEATAEEVPA